MRGSPLCLFSLLLLLLALSATGWRHHPDADYYYDYYPIGKARRGRSFDLDAYGTQGRYYDFDQASDDESIQSHMDYLRSLGGGEVDGDIARELARQRIRRRRRYY
ncbi:hypothetical protein EGR_02030 [Echinococcus granulosus]|uniref:Neuropeptide n=1 Tax=Echinococcus granulosus TaxID=6210 RepID=W6URB1_ECHGR|nr:hypothetical protein EGR_02030 [Echinococcus granulosus]EUB63226.1 hypothetical protein EGR_02030 [Echinococcus granulosus]